jgi:hypothetical protein
LVFPRSSIFADSKSRLNLAEKISMLLNASLIASGPNRVPGLKECVESKGTPNTTVDILALSFGLVINVFRFRYKSRKLIVTLIISLYYNNISNH